MSVRVFAPAKINVTLEVGRPRSDGYHPLQSAVMFADIGDWIEASPAEALSLTVTGAFASGLGDGADNLVLRAALLLGPGRGAALRLEKNLPIAAGIGGGSSDAAAALVALNELWNCGRSRDELAHIAASIGADVPVCVQRNSAWITGTGATVTPMQAPPLSAVLVNPGKALATPAVYQRFDDLGLGRTFEQRRPPRWENADAVFSSIILCGNDLETPALSLMPQLGELLAMLRADPRAACAGLSGSGATCFALTRNADDAAGLALDLASRNPAWWVRAAKLGAA
jgi:4-diphosphocytidyl-2-C-methyl-D-erythritol kinase